MTRLPATLSKLACLTALACGAGHALAQETPTAPTHPLFDADLAQRLGADAIGMRNYVLVILKTGPNKMPAGPERDAMFKGHFANMKRLSDEGKLMVAGPADGVEGWRGIFVFAVTDVAQAKALAASDPVLINGEMVAEYHKVYLSAALMETPALHRKIAQKSF